MVFQSVKMFPAVVIGILRLNSVIYTHTMKCTGHHGIYLSIGIPYLYTILLS